LLCRRHNSGALPPVHELLKQPLYLETTVTNQNYTLEEIGVKDEI
jgi:hypothetical protein